MDVTNKSDRQTDKYAQADHGMNTDRRKFPTKLSLYGVSSFHFYCYNQLKVFLMDAAPM